MAESLQELQVMPNSLSDSSRRVDLWMNMEKTKVMYNAHVTPRPVTVNGATLEVKSYARIHLFRPNYTIRVAQL